ncbi:MAG: HD domain-containing protein [bacterium]|nr:HD domain-containing protein [bacterium]
MRTTTQPGGDADKLRTLLSVSRLIAGRLELRSLIGEVVHQASQLVTADRCTLWLYDHARQEIYTFIGEGLATEFRLPIGHGVAGAAAAQRRILHIDDAYQSPYFNPEFDKQSGYKTKSLLAVPMESHEGRLLGVFQAINRLDPAEPDGLGVFSQFDVELLMGLSGIATVAVENALLYEEQKRQFNSFIITLASTVDAKDPTTSKHTMMVTGVAVALARHLALSTERVERIRIAAILHDYGKIGIPDEVLLKAGMLDDSERRTMQSHVMKTSLLLSRIRFRRDLDDVPTIAAMHHEKLDGTGYPYGLRGEEIPLEGRVLAVADVFHALTQTRPYKAGRSPQEALGVCRQMSRKHLDREGNPSGLHLDPNVVDALAGVLEHCNNDMCYFEKESGWDEMLAT